MNLLYTIKNMEKFQKESEIYTQIHIWINCLKAIIVGSVLSACTNVPKIQNTPVVDIPTPTVSAPQESIQKEPIAPIPIPKDIKKWNRKQASDRWVWPLWDAICKVNNNITSLCKNKPSQISYFTEEVEEIWSKWKKIQVILKCTKTTYFNQKNWAVRHIEEKCNEVKQ